MDSAEILSSCGPRTYSFKFMRAVSDLECGAALGRHVAQHTTKLYDDRAKLRS
ncbi:hypothetical protein HanXRQr2_Chr02g0048431 [Helianthus annuus]|uniref:Uncharacterized protein n=1 Tax=Helianthus annuus TaxID=4232 RepID=A0A251VDZ6_HELAN|nr:hypothetical protein HanXRQr2_Chr02g0048431 [Helianthus annuus]KAJ0950403.1 hypothetical protein HanPSC8_Chr02g0047921 [Helianthus annuus]